jgi:Sulfotransferase family
MVIHRPDFIVIGAMKSATTTLHEQLARQPGFLMSRPKEPNFFSDDRIYARGWTWYSSLFRPGHEAGLRGESSTHYTKLPDYPRTVARMVRDLPAVKLIYLMRHPIDRLMSHYVHEQTTGRIKVGVQEAVERHHELIEYSRYAMQLQPFLDAYGFENVLPVFFPRLVYHPQAELERIGRFLNHDGPLVWDTTLKPQNSGKERMRPSPIRQALVQAPVLCGLRQRVLPRTWSESLKEFWRAQIEPPVLQPELIARLRDVFDADLAQLGSWLGITLDCEAFHDTAIERPHHWVVDRSPARANKPKPLNLKAALPFRP